MNAGGEGGSADLDGAFRQHESMLVRFIAARVGCRATAQDLTQEVFLRAQGAHATSVFNPRAFLFRIAANLVFNHQLQHRRRAELTDEVKELLGSGIDEATPERHLLAAEELARVAEALCKLSERSRQVLVLSRFDGVKQSEIAVRLGISTTAVENHLRKALVALASAAQADSG